jgi:N-ethylmaleimide reductase
MVFEPIRLGPHLARNRVVMAPMTRNRASEGGIPNDLMARYYAQRAAAGLIISEGAQISVAGRAYPRTPGIHDPCQVQGWQRVTDAVHAEGGIIFLQLWHAGRISHPLLQPGGSLPVAPSAIKPDGTIHVGTRMVPFERPRALEVSEILAIVADFATAARNALEARFDGVEVQAGNGYLIDQFLRDGSNHRHDEFGGSATNRSKLLMYVVEAVTAVWGADRVGVRLSPAQKYNSMSDSDAQRTFEYAISELSKRSLAYVHAVENRETDFDWSSFRRCFGGLYIANGGYDLNSATAAVESGHADLVSFGRLFISNPDLVTRFRLNASLSEPYRATFYGGDDRGYTDYPTLDEWR